MDDGKFYKHNGEVLPIRGGAWLDIFNSCFYTEIERVRRLNGLDAHICVDTQGEKFVLLWG